MITAIIIAAVLEDRVRFTTTAHPAHLEWTYRKLNDKGYLVLEAAEGGATFFVRLPFLWLTVYLRQLSGLQNPLLAAFQPLRQFMEHGQAFWWQEFEDFNCQFLALRINLLKLKHALLPSIMPSSCVTVEELFKGAVVSADCAGRVVQLPPGFVTAVAISGALSQRFPLDSQPKDDEGKIIAWDSGTVVVRNVAGAPQDHFCVLLAPHGGGGGGAVSLPSLVSCQDKYTETGDALTSSHLQEEYDKCKASVMAPRFNRAAQFQFLFTLFANRPAAADLDLVSTAPPPCSIVVLAEQCRSFYGYTFVERAKFAATMTGEATHTNS